MPTAVDEEELIDRLPERLVDHPGFVYPHPQMTQEQYAEYINSLHRHYIKHTGYDIQPKQSQNGGVEFHADNSGRNFVHLHDNGGQLHGTTASDDRIVKALVKSWPPGAKAKLHGNHKEFERLVLKYARDHGVQVTDSSGKIHNQHGGQSQAQNPSQGRTQGQNNGRPNTSAAPNNTTGGNGNGTGTNNTTNAQSGNTAGGTTANRNGAGGNGAGRNGASRNRPGDPFAGDGISDIDSDMDWGNTGAAPGVTIDPPEPQLAPNPASTTTDVLPPPLPPPDRDRHYEAAIRSVLNRGEAPPARDLMYDLRRQDPHINLTRVEKMMDKMVVDGIITGMPNGQKPREIDSGKGEEILRMIRAGEAIPSDGSSYYKHKPNAKPAEQKTEAADPLQALRDDLVRRMDELDQLYREGTAIRGSEIDELHQTIAGHLETITQIQQKSADDIAERDAVIQDLVGKVEETEQARIEEAKKLRQDNHDLQMRITKLQDAIVASGNARRNDAQVHAEQMNALGNLFAAATREHGKHASELKDQIGDLSSKVARQAAAMEAMSKNDSGSKTERPKNDVTDTIMQDGVYVAADAPTAQTRGRPILLPPVEAKAPQAEAKDPKFAETVAAVRGFGEAHAPTVARRLGIDVARVSAMFDQMHAEGIVGPANGEFARKLLRDQDAARPSSGGENPGKVSQKLEIV